MKNYKELLHYCKDISVSAVIEDLYLDLIHRTETIDKLSRKIQKLKKVIRREQDLKEYQYSLKESAYTRLWNAEDKINKTISHIENLIQIINEQPSRNIEEDNYILDRLEGFIEILKGENNER